ncbi:alpha/beta hydrolase [Micromonospora sp. NPDC047074]|uniref:alpha/beta fold hydrolase n=1 Tax=Micromonospora sp. NPDC047074 TaxID=3154339 RepID=UPI0033F3B6DD
MAGDAAGPARPFGAASRAAPTLVVTGSRGPVVPPAWRSQVGRLVPHARTVTVPGAAHNVATTVPAQVADAIRALLAPTLTNR